MTHTLSDPSRINRGTEGVKKWKGRHKEFTITNTKGKESNLKKYSNLLRDVRGLGTTVHKPKGKLIK